MAYGIYPLTLSARWTYLLIVPSKTAKSIIQAQIRELQQLDKLLDSPYIAAILPKLLEARLHGTAKSQQSSGTPKKKSGRQPGPLVKKALDIVINSMTEVTAKDVLFKLLADGVAVPGKDKAVTVSKILRKLAQAGKISSRPSGPSKKAAILYQSNALAASFPAGEKTVTH
jgi:hypothetical protein